MKDRKPSQTASLVAFLRALADEGLTTARGFSDPFARELLPPGWSLFFRVARWRMRHARARERVAAQLDMIPLRVLAIDAEVEGAVASGCRQVVILGAGLDARAWRMDSLADAHVFEVDHPSTQVWKRKKVVPFRPRAAALTFVAVNFERDDLLLRLREAGHRTDAPTVWIWEGVVTYLTDEGLRSTLRAIAAASAPGSTAVIQFAEPGDTDRQDRVREIMLSMWGEPQIGRRSLDVMRREVEAAGLEVTRVSASEEWARRFGAKAPQLNMGKQMRIVVATKR